MVGLAHTLSRSPAAPSLTSEPPAPASRLLPAGEPMYGASFFTDYDEKKQELGSLKDVEAQLASRKLLCEDSTRPELTRRCRVSDNACDGNGVLLIWIHLPAAGFVPQSPKCLNPQNALMPQSPKSKWQDRTGLEHPRSGKT